MKEKIREFEKENTITFSKKRELIQFVSMYMAFQYKRFLNAECAMAMDSEELKDYWEYKNFTCVSKFENALKVILPFKLMRNNNFEINHESGFLKVAFKYAGETVQPLACFAKNVKYEIKNLTFEKIFF